MASWIARGKQCICIRFPGQWVDTVTRRPHEGVVKPVPGGTYTIGDIEGDVDGVWLSFDELGLEYGWSAAGFRPTQSSALDVALFAPAPSRLEEFA